MAKLGDQSVGSIVKLNVGGTARNFIVVHQGNPDTSLYDASCDGTWLLMEDVYTTMAYYSGSYSSSAIYYNSSNPIHKYLNDTFLGLLDDDIQEVLTSVKIPYCTNSGQGSGYTYGVATGSSGLSVKVFLLSYFETGRTFTGITGSDGACLSYFKGTAQNSANPNQVGYYNGTASTWWLRSPRYQYSSEVYYVTENGDFSSGAYRNTQGVRPALILSADLGVESDGTIVTSTFSGRANIGGTWKELAGGYANIGGTWKELLGAYMNIGGTWKPMA